MICNGNFGEICDWSQEMLLVLERVLLGLGHLRNWSILDTHHLPHERVTARILISHRVWNARVDCGLGW